MKEGLRAYVWGRGVHGLAAGEARATEQSARHAEPQGEGEGEGEGEGWRGAAGEERGGEAREAANHRMGAKHSRQAGREGEAKGGEMPHGGHDGFRRFAVGSGKVYLYEVPTDASILGLLGATTTTTNNNSN